MKTGKTLTELAIEIDRQRKAKQDILADTRDMTVVEQPDGGAKIALRVEGQATYPVNALALDQIAERTGIPAKYAQRMAAVAPALLATNVGHWFQAKNERRLVRTLDGTARAFLSDRYQRTDNWDVLNAALPILQEVPGLEVRSCEVTERRLYLKASFSSIAREVKSRRVGDVVEAGVLISNSEVGLGAITVKPFAFFLVCLNGMTRDGGKRWAHIGRRIEGDGDVTLSQETLQSDDKTQLLMVRDHIKAALDSSTFDSFIAKMNGATVERISGNPAKAVEVLGENLILSADEQGSILRHLIDGGDISRYGVMNAVTRAAQDVVSYDRASELEALGSRVIDLPASEWKVVAEAA